MKRALKYLLLASVAALAFAALAAYLAATSDPNAYKPWIERWVKEQTGRTLQIEGPLQLAFFPRPGIRLGPVALSERTSNQEFASAQSAYVSLALLPLLRKELQVDRVVIRGLKLNLVRTASGTTNLDDLLGGGASRFRTEIKKLTLEGAAFQVRDEARGVQFALEQVNLAAGPIAEKVPADMALAFSLKSAHPSLELDTRIQGRIVFDSKAQRLNGKALAMEANGRLGSVGKVEVSALGDVIARLSAGSVSLRELKIAASAAKGETAFKAALEAPRFDWAAGHFAIARLALVSRVAGGAGEAEVRLKTPQLAGTPRVVAADLALDWNGQWNGAHFSGKLASPLKGSLETGKFELSRLTAAFVAEGPEVPGQRVAGELAGRASVDGKGQVVAADLAGRLLGSPARGKIVLSGFTRPHLRFDAALDQLDAARLASRRKAAEPVDLSRLEKLDADGRLEIGVLKLGDTRASRVRLELRGGVEPPVP